MGKVKKGKLLVVFVAAAMVGGGMYWLWKHPRLPVSNSSPVVPVESPVPTEPAGNGQVDELTVTASNFKFVPAMVKVKKGDTVRVTFKNSEGFHDFVIDEFGVKTNQINEEDEEQVEFVASKTGTFEYYCSVGNHRKMGMVGKLVVE